MGYFSFGLNQLDPRIPCNFRNTCISSTEPLKFALSQDDGPCVGMPSQHLLYSKLGYRTETLSLPHNPYITSHITIPELSHPPAENALLPQTWVGVRIVFHPKPCRPSNLPKNPVQMQASKLELPREESERECWLEISQGTMNYVMGS